MYEQQPNAQWRYDFVLDGVAGMAAPGLVVIFDSGTAPNLYATWTGCAPAYRESHLLCPPDARSRWFRGQKFAARKRPPRA